MEPTKRPLWTRTAETADGKATLEDARRLSMDPQYYDLSDAELIRLAYYGASGASNG